ncbi:MAG: thioredoxin family protein [Opitutaceae bacterium]|nr:thioredoxin family protein [Opitutaceae bacterium]
MQILKSLTKSTAGIFALLASAALAIAAQVGQPAPDFTLTDIDGKTHTLSDYKGKTVVLEWMNQECPFVVKHYEKSGNIPATQRAATADGVIWLVINSGRPGAQGDFSPEKVREWSKQQNTSYTAYFRDQDGKVGRLYDAKTTPHMYVINPEGTLVYNGAIDSIRSANPKDIAKAENYVTSALAAVKAGEPVKTPATQAYGCTVKY